MRRPHSSIVVVGAAVVTLSMVAACDSSNGGSGVRADAAGIGDARSSGGGGAGGDARSSGGGEAGGDIRSSGVGGGGGDTRSSGVGGAGGDVARIDAAVGAGGTAGSGGSFALDATAVVDLVLDFPIPGGDVGSGGGQAVDGNRGSGGTAGVGGTYGVDGPSAAGGAQGLDGRLATGGASATGGTQAPDAAPSSGGAVGTGGRSGTGGGQGTGGASGTGGSQNLADAATVTDALDANLAMDGAADGPGPIALPMGHCGARRGLYFPATSWIYADITSAPTRSNSSATTTWLETNGGWGNGNRLQMDISFVILDADGSTPRVARTANDPIDYSPDCDPGVSMPIPAGGRIEGQPNYVCGDRANGNPAGDCHMLVVDFSSNILFESYLATYTNNLFYTNCTVAWDMGRDVWGAPPEPGSTLPPVSTRNWGIGRQCTGPDAAGFPIAPLLLTIGDIQSGKVEHAIRFILPNNRIQKAANASDRSPVFVWPATHAGGPNAVSANAPIYGSRWRLKANFDPASRGLDPANPVVRAVVYGLQHHGMLLSDGGDIAFTAEDGTGCGQTWDDLWGSKGSRVLNGILPGDFDVVDTGGTDAGWDCVRNSR